MTTLVLGWDALDYEICEQRGYTDAFGGRMKRIETFDNDYLGEPHTQEVWPSIITGVMPTEHGIYAATEDGTVEWDNPAIAVAARLAAGVVPQRVRSWIGKQLRSGGAGISQKSPGYYAELGLSTVFDGYAALPVSVPNYYRESDRFYGVSSDRGALWDDIVSDKNPDGYEASTTTERVTERLVSAAGRRYGIAAGALDYDYDIVFVWFGYLDSAGHFAPSMPDGWHVRQYKRAWRWTERLSRLADDTIIVSDHGLRGGDHTHDAVLASTKPIPPGVESVTDVRGYIEYPADSDGEVTGEQRDMTDTREVLEDLGYL